MSERENVERENRDKETKILNLTHQLNEMKSQMEETERCRLQQQSELEDLMSSKDDVGKYVRILLFP